MFWEYEDTYRFRGQMFLSLMDKVALKKNPRKELRRLCDLMSKRELNPYMKNQWLMIKKLIRFIPISKIKDFMLSLDLEVFKMDSSDRYFADRKQDFNYD